MNEKEVILPKGRSLRPDRLVISEDKVHIIDYKTGLAMPNHKAQVDEYAGVLADMGLRVGDKVLIYLDDQIAVEKW